MRRISTLFTLCLLALGCARAASDAERFNAPQRLETGSSPTAVVVFDATGDGLADLIIANQGSNDLIVFAGDGNGAFRTVARFNAGPNPEGLAAGDFDEDGDLDLAIANHETLYLTLLFNQGDGDFTAGADSPLSLPVRPHPHVVQAVDMDNDGHLDLLVDDREGEGFVLLRGAGDGSFGSPPQHIDAGGDPYLGMATGFLNDDAYPDIVAPLRRRVSVVLSRGGDYGHPVSLRGGGAFAVHLAHMNEDSRPDLIKATEAGEVVLFRGLGAGNFDIEKTWQVARGAKRVASGDLNGDGAADIVVQNYLARDLFVLLSRSGELETASVAAGKNPWGLAIADLNRDGRDDIVSLDNTGDAAFVFLSPGRDSAELAGVGAARAHGKVRE